MPEIYLFGWWMERVSTVLPLPFSQDCWFTRNHQNAGHESLKEKCRELLLVSLPFLNGQEGWDACPLHAIDLQLEDLAWHQHGNWSHVVVPSTANLRISGNCILEKKRSWPLSSAPNSVALWWHLTFSLPIRLRQPRIPADSISPRKLLTWRRWKLKRPSNHPCCARPCNALRVRRGACIDRTPRIPSLSLSRLPGGQCLCLVKV